MLLIFKGAVQIPDLYSYIIKTNVMNFKLYALLVVFLGISITAKSQVSEESRKMSQGVHPALVMTLPDIDHKDAEDVWEDYIEDFYDCKTKRNRRSDEYFSDNAEIVAIAGSNTVDIYASIEESGDTNTEIAVWFDLGGAYLNSREHPNRFAEAEKLMLRFALEAARSKTNKELEDQEDKLKDLQKDLKRLERANKRYHNDIEEAKKRIKDAEENIEENEKEQVDMKALIEAQLKAIELIKKRLSDL
jgi:gas vesicle protein